MLSVSWKFKLYSIFISIITKLILSSFKEHNVNLLFSKVTIHSDCCVFAYVPFKTDSKAKTLQEFAEFKLE